MKEELLKIISGNRITLPKDFRERYDLGVGDYVKAIWNDDKEGGLRLLPGKVVLSVTIRSEEEK